MLATGGERVRGALSGSAPGPRRRGSALSLGSSLHGAAHGGFGPWIREPTRDLDLVLGEEADAVLTGGMQVPVEGVLHAVEREKRPRGGDAYVDPEHPGLYVLAPVPDGCPILGEDRAGVTERRAVGELYGLVQGIHPHHGEDRTEDLLTSDAHLAAHAIQDRRPHEEALLQRWLPAVEDDRCALFLAKGYVASDLFAVGVPDHGGELAIFVARPHLHGLGLLLDGLDQPVGHVTHGDEHAAGQAPLPGVAVGGGDYVGDSLLEDRVRQHYHGVLRPCQGLHPLSVGGSVLVDVLGDRVRSHEGDGFYAGVLEDRIHSLPGPVDNVEDPVGEPRFFKQLPEPHRRNGRPLGGLEDVCVAGPDGYRQGPQGHHAREVEGCYGRHHTQGVAVTRVVYAASDVAHRLAHDKRGHPAGELHHLNAAPDLSPGVLCVLAVLQGDEIPEFLEVLLKERLEAKQDAGALHDRGVGPARERLFGLGYRLIYVLAGRKWGLGDDLAGGRIVNRLGLTPVASLPLAPDQIPHLEGLLSCLHFLTPPL